MSLLLFFLRQLSPQKPLLKTHDVYLSQERHAQVVKKINYLNIVRIPIWLASIGSVQIITHPKTPSLAIPAYTVRVKTLAHVFGHTFKPIICIKDTCQRFIFHFSLCNVFSFFSWDIRRINASVFNLTFFFLFFLQCRWLKPIWPWWYVWWF